MNKTITKFKAIAILSVMTCFGAMAQDMGVTALLSPVSPMCNISSQAIIVTVKNFDVVPINFATTNCPISITITGANANTVNTTLTTGTLAAGASMNVTVSPNTIMSASGTSTFNAATSVAGDLNSANDALTAVNITVTAITNTLTSTLSIKHTSMCAGTADTLNAVVTDAGDPTGPFTYAWSPAGVVSKTGDTNTFTPSKPGLNKLWKVLVTDAQGCQATDSIRVNVNGMVTTGTLGALTAKHSVLCAGIADTLIAQPITAVLGTNTSLSSITYGWSPVNNPSRVTVTADTNIFTPSKPGSNKLWKATMTDGNGCVLIDSIRVNVNGPQTTGVLSAKHLTMCAGTPDTLVGNLSGDLGSLVSSVHYTWSPTGIVSVTGDTNTFTPGKPGSNKLWTMTLIDAAGCTAIDSIRVNVNGMVTTGTLGALTAKHSVLCAGIADTLIAQPITAVLGTNTNLSSIIYAWSPVNNPSKVTLTADTNIFTPSKPGSNKLWKATMTDGNGCVLIDSIRVNVNGPQTTGILSAKLLTMCAGTADTLFGNLSGDLGSAVSSVHYTWSPTGIVSVTGDTNIFTPSKPGSNKLWKMTLIDAAGCIGIDSIRVNVNGPQTTGILSAKHTTFCAGIADTLIGNLSGDLGSPVSSVHYTWKPSGVITVTGDTNTVTAAKPGANKLWTMTLIDAAGCTATDSIRVNINGPQTTGILSAKHTTFCAGIADTLIGNLSGDLGSPVNSVHYTWKPSGVVTVTGDTNTVTAAKPGANKLWTMTLIDAAGCTATDSIRVNINGPQTTGILSAKHTTFCAGIADTLIGNLSGDLGSPVNSVHYTWKPSGVVTVTGDTNTVTAAKPGANKLWTMTLIDAAGCTGTDSIRVNINGPQTTGILSAKHTTFCANIADTLIGNLSGDIGSPVNSVHYTWKPSGVVTSTGDTNTVTATKPGSNKLWTMTLIDAAGCTATDSIRVNINGPTVVITGDTLVKTGVKDTLTASGTSTSYVWSTSSTKDTAIVMPTKKTTYTVTGTAAGCSVSVTFTVDVKNTNGIENLSASVKGEAYPNPASTLLNLKFDMGASALQADVRVFDIAGKELIAMPTEITSDKIVSLNITSLPSGVYFVRVTTNESNQVVKFIKQ